MANIVSAQCSLAKQGSWRFVQTFPNATCIFIVTTQWLNVEKPDVYIPQTLRDKRLSRGERNGEINPSGRGRSSHSTP